MLGKQGWEILQEPESLFAQILRAKYFPGDNVMRDEPMHGMSYTWRSILKGIKLLNDGIIWRIGDGQSVRIWEDPWLPRNWTRRPIMPRGANLITRVAELIDPGIGS